MQKIKPIRSDDDLDAVLARIDQLWGASPETSDGDELDVLCDLVEHYENRWYPVEPIEPIELLHMHMTATGRVQADLAELFGSRSRASEVLNRKRALTVDMIHRLSSVWNIPAECLVKPYQVSERSTPRRGD
ncbi:transcriptional regulator [Phaeobacter inhibens]|uniref:helix-turn-helix domain-containing protein n=1 Tax=Phaeobacter inhibens TaxID=221822 RepID=UPI0021A7DBA4|nr:transcriptional regulator [Phaeobacter inhibens]UWR53654.1 transcriptional regulator [Phaeobacter inhibens]